MNDSAGTRAVSIPQQFHRLKQEAVALYEMAHTAMESNRRTRMMGPNGADGNYHFNQSQFLKSVQFARIMEANNPAVASALNRLTNNVNVGQMIPEPDTGSDQLNEHLQGLWSDYVVDPERCCSQGRLTYEAQADIAFRSVIRDADILAVADADNPTSCLNLESQRCQSPTFGVSAGDRGICGVRRKGGRFKEYFLVRHNPQYNGVIRPQDGEWTPVYNSDGWRQISHVINPKMFSVDRGFSALGSIATTESMRDDLQHATVLRGQVAACVTFIEKALDPAVIMRLIEKNLQSGGNDDFPDATAEVRRFDEDGPGYNVAMAKMTPGQVLRSRLGYGLEMQTPAMAGEGQLELNMLLLQFLAMVLDLPLIVLLMDCQSGSFSQFRGVMDLARDAFRKHQRWFANQYHRFRYVHFVRSQIPHDAMLRQFLRTEHHRRAARTIQKSKLFRHDWVGKAYRYYQPVDDTAADVMALANGMKSFDMYARERYGMPGRRLAAMVINQNAEIMGMALEKASELEKKYGRPVNEALLFPFASMTGIHLNMSQDVGTQAVQQPGQLNSRDQSAAAQDVSKIISSLVV